MKTQHERLVCFLKYSYGFCLEAGHERHFMQELTGALGSYLQILVRKRARLWHFCAFFPELNSYQESISCDPNRSR